MYRGYSSVTLQELFEIDTSSKGTRGHSSKLKKVRCTREYVSFGQGFSLLWTHTLEVFL